MRNLIIFMKKRGKNRCNAIQTPVYCLRTEGSGHLQRSISSSPPLSGTNIGGTGETKIEESSAGMTKFTETLFFLPDPVSAAPFKLYSAGITHPDPHYNISRQDGTDSYYVLEYIVSGKGHLYCGDHYYTPVTGDVYLLDPGIPHEYHSDHENPWEKIWFNVGGPLPASLIEVYRFSGMVYFPNCPLEKEFRCALETIRIRPPDVYYQFAMQLHGILCGLDRWRKSHPERKKSSEGIRMKEYLDANPRRNITIAELSALIRKSPAQTLRIFQRDWNISPYNYLQRQRFQTACQYLENTDSTIANIARLTGFKDEFYFSNWFKRKSGSSPMLYKQRYRQKEPQNAIS